MTEVSAHGFKVGDKVRLIENPDAGVGEIELFYLPQKMTLKDRDIWAGGIEGGVRLKETLDGFWSWNLADLIPA